MGGFEPIRFMIITGVRLRREWVAPGLVVNLGPEPNREPNPSPDPSPDPNANANPSPDPNANLSPTSRIMSHVPA